MRAWQCSQGGVRNGRPFFFIHALTALASLLFCATPAAQAASCTADRTSERVRVIHIYDGDTLKLDDGRRLRLIGINTPEIDHDGPSSQPLAEQARDLLATLISRWNRTLNLQYGRQSRDHYGRLLAHAFLDDGSNVAVRLLEQGLATTLVVPPNTWNLSCYQRIETAAREAGRGLWALPGYQVIAGTDLQPDTRGFRIVRGRVIDIRKSRNSLWLDLEGPLVVHVSRKDLINFDPGFPDALAGKTVELRGWIKEDRHGLRVSLRHPAALTAITP
jgi:endonuclease YncB( thermonuclease family)